jgi:hypothetical protein
MNGIDEPGRDDELVAPFQEMNARLTEAGEGVNRTDASGPFFTVVMEIELEDFADWREGSSTR